MLISNMLTRFHRFFVRCTRKLVKILKEYFFINAMFAKYQITWNWRCFVYVTVTCVCDTCDTTSPNSYATLASYLAGLLAGISLCYVWNVGQASLHYDFFKESAYLVTW